MIFLDAGHGGKDPGAVGNGLQEKILNLTVTLEVQDILKRYGLITVMARTADEYLVLKDRTDKANRTAGVNLYVSIHHNNFTNPDARGAEFFRPIKGGVGAVVAEYICNMYKAYVPIPIRGVKTKASESNSNIDYHHVIRETKMPAVIVEGGFISNPDDAELLKNQEVLSAEARAIAMAILKWKGITPVEVNVYPPNYGDVLRERNELLEKIRKIKEILG